MTDDTLNDDAEITALRLERAALIDSIQYCSWNDISKADNRIEEIDRRLQALNAPIFVEESYEA